MWNVTHLESIHHFSRLDELSDVAKKLDHNIFYFSIFYFDWEIHLSSCIVALPLHQDFKVHCSTFFWSNVSNNLIDDDDDQIIYWKVFFILKNILSFTSSFIHMTYIRFWNPQNKIKYILLRFWNIYFI